MIQLTWPLNSASAAGQEMTILSVPDTSALLPSDVSAVSLDFKVLHSVVITQMGVFPNGPRDDFRGNVTVQLFQVDQEVRAQTQSGVWHRHLNMTH